MVRPIETKDHQAVVDIYNHYIDHTIVTFEELPIDVEEITSRIDAVKPQLPWLVFEDKKSVLGYAYASSWKGRCAYRFSAECTVYVKDGALGKGIGTQLYRSLITKMQALDYHVLIGGVSLPNAGSIALHEKLGFRKVAHFEEVGFKFDRWIDVGYWQLIL